AADHLRQAAGCPPSPVARQEGETEMSADLRSAERVRSHDVAQFGALRDAIRQAPESALPWKLYGSPSRPQTTHGAPQNRRRAAHSPVKARNDPQPSAPARSLQAGGHRFDPGW